MIELLGTLGANANVDQDQTVEVTSANINNFRAPYELVRTMRASFLVLGPLLARFGQAQISLPGGCAIGTRPVDQHLLAIQSLGARVDILNGYVSVRAEGRLRGSHISFDISSVGATQNALMAASLAEGATRITNAAAEPEVVELARLLVQMGARIEGIGTREIHVEGRESLKGTTYTVIPDRIEAGTYAIAAALTGGDVRLRNCGHQHWALPIAKMREAGVRIRSEDDALLISNDGGELLAVDVETGPYPGFPTDMQAQFLTLNSVARGTSTVTETIFENRFMHVQELVRLGANVSLKDSRTAVVTGVDQLKGAQVMATDLRASSSLVLAGLVATGVTLVDRIYHIDRGYERIEEKLQHLGADVERVN